MTIREVSATWIEIAASGIAIGLALVLVPRIGTLGATLAVAAGSTARNA